MATAAGIAGLRAGAGGKVACPRLAAWIPAGAIAWGAAFLPPFASGLLPDLPAALLLSAVFSDLDFVDGLSALCGSG